MSADQEHEGHPHDAIAGVPVRLEAAELRELSRLQPARALLATALEWLGIAAAVALVSWRPGVVVYLLAVVFIGARQHALTVLGHDASHHRYLNHKLGNDLVASVFLMWPMFVSVWGFRSFHGDHHKYLGGVRDGNRLLWRTHTGRGELRPEWVYPKTRGELVRELARRAAFATGLRWIVRGLIGSLMLREPGPWRVARLGCYAAAIAVLSVGGWWLEYVGLWLVPMCTWHVTIQYMRLIAEHSAVHSDDPAYQATRTTIPTRLEALLILPRNIGYHIEHHWYPSVPFYKLPALHARLMREPGFRRNADISTSILRSMILVTKR
ncbi:Fatty acid desaturase [Enhygromyxa salina]|uniref:Fatty acid desaturase n=1 Tax=Enhygromyxa salina TaxID=215803 RepID=A0A0C2D5Y9_9BACT|nr:fatty acid desaturase family protein [Enhygromyxa salina]KIG15462.1 Fatty acid desaturase [Enhygromyxa salina]